MRLLLADHHTQSRWALKTIVQEESGFDLVGEAIDVGQLLELAGEHGPDLILVDQRLPGTHIGELVATLHAFKPRPIVVVMSGRSEDSRIALRAGADAFVSKEDRPEWLLNTLRKYADQITTNRDFV